MLKTMRSLLIIATSCLAACAPQGPTDVQPVEEDPLLWLEDIRSARALEWVEAENERSLERLTGDPRYAALLEEATHDLTLAERLPSLTILGDHGYDLLRDRDFVRGLWRRAELESLAAGAPAWEPVLDLDALAADEGENWVFGGATCLSPESDRCMLGLSRGGSDAVVYREFDLTSKAFVDGGFSLPEAKTTLAWAERDTLLVSSATDADDTTTSGYGRLVRRWTRDTELSSAPVAMEIPADHIGAWPATVMDGDRKYVTANDIKTLLDYRVSLMADDGTFIELPLPSSFEYSGIFDGRAFGRLRVDWTQNDASYQAGSLVAFELAPMVAGGDLPAAELLFTPEPNQAIQMLLGQGSRQTKDAIFISLLEDVVGRLVKISRDGGGWRSELVEIAGEGSVSLVAAHGDSNTLIVRYEDFLTPPTLIAYGDGSPQRFATIAPKFEAEGYQVVQHFATSPDGTRVPYFVVGPADLNLDGQAPALIGAYGGFGLSQTPAYLGGYFGGGLPFKTILRAGGSFVLANIRGGAEYGPEWHLSGVLENRQRVYDDYYAVAEDLITRGYTSSERLGIIGASNSGLLVGVAFTQRPDLYEAVMCSVPLLDMKRYHQLLAGASWMSEYGDPDDPAMWEVIKGYSPYQNLKEDAEYPEVFFTGSTADDRVHPGHARKMAAKMQDHGQPFLFFENIEGGHGAAANLNQKAKLDALQSVYMLQKLTGDGGPGEPPAD
ncbi:MAG: prolyl oligopeptidase family serine peptidase [Acidobacteriota bacterium]